MIFDQTTGQEVKIPIRQGGMVMAMNRLTTVWVRTTLPLLAVAVIGCAVSQPPPSLTIVPTVSLTTIAGEWKGLSKRLPDMHDDAWVILIIDENGSFTFASNREAELLLGVGHLTVRDGIVVAKGNQGAGMLTLHDGGGHKVLVVQAALNDGRHYYLEMTRVD